MITDNPVFRCEMCAHLRFRHLGSSQPLLWITSGLLFLVTCLYLWGLKVVRHGLTADMRDFRSLFVNGLLVLIVLLAPALASTAITKEREQQTWDTLTVTRLTAAQIIVGKWLARLVPLGFLMLIALPFLFVAGFKDGMSLCLNACVLIFLALNAGLYGLIGLLCSFRARKTASATAAALAISALLWIGTRLIDELLQSCQESHHTTVVMWINPFFALSALTPGDRDTGIVVFYLTASLVTMGAAFRYMITRYRSAVPKS